jgi:glutathione reductase (NADPH)
MRPESFVVVIGSGAAGTAAARTLAAAGVRVAVVEDDKVGGTCLWHGCMPKKALHNAATAYLDAAKAEEFGVTCEGRALDWEGVLAWKWHAQETYAGDPGQDFADRGIDLVRGSAVFEAPLTLRVGDRVLEATDVVIACGSAPSIPPIPGAEACDTSEQALHYPSPPATLAIVGGGYIAMEFASIYSAFGTHVTVLARGDRFLAGTDPELFAIVMRRLQGQGVTFRTNARTTGVRSETGVMELAFDDGETLTAERVLMATGRHPRVAELLPQAAGLALDERGHLVVDAMGRTSDLHVWVAGDAAGGPMHTPVANEQGHHVAEAMLGRVDTPLDLSWMPTAVFTMPQIAQVGMTEDRAAAAGIGAHVCRGGFSGIGAAIISDDRDGLIKLVAADNDGRVLGCQIAARDASDLIYPYALAVHLKATAEDVKTTVAIHPAYTQAIEWGAW